MISFRDNPICNEPNYRILGILSLLEQRSQIFLLNGSRWKPQPCGNRALLESRDGYLFFAKTHQK